MVTWYSTNINLAPVHAITTQTYSTKSALASNEARSIGTHIYNTKQDIEFSEAHSILFSYVSHTYPPPA
jgi:Tfp pilus assembly ATPase PilU